MRILIVTDAWFPQVNGVVRTLDNTTQQLTKLGHEVRCLNPGLFRTVPCPLYPEVRLCWPRASTVWKRIEDFLPDRIHIATEGPLGMAARRACLKKGCRFTTSFHTMFPEYLKRLAFIPETLSWKFMRWFHRPASSTLVPTTGVMQRLRSLGFSNLAKWQRGIDLEKFGPRLRRIDESERPVLMYTGRVSKEKNIEDFLRLRIPGIKYIVGDGPLRARLEKQYPEARFVGYKHGEDLAQAYSEADVLVFPSRTDTFGNVLLEALSAGTPLAAYPEPGPVELISNPALGAFDDNLERAVALALEKGVREKCREAARNYTWQACTEQFLSNLVPVLLQKSHTGITPV